MKTFELVSEEYLSADNKKLIIESLLDIDASDNKTVVGVDPAVPGEDKTVRTPVFEVSR
jgi:hypothetical protein